MSIIGVADLSSSSQLNQFTSVAELRSQMGLGAGPSPLVYNVMDPAYGAKGDGVTDDSAAIQAAITAAGTAGGGIVFLPPATYVVNTTLTGTASNIILQGAGWKTALSRGAAGDVIAWTGSSEQGFTVRDMEISIGSSSGWCINLNNCPGSLIHHVEFVGGSASGGGVKGTNNSHSTLVIGCSAGSIIGTAYYFDTSCGGVKIVNNRADGVSQSAGSIGVRACGPGSVVTGNTLESLDVAVSLIDGAQGIQITGNHFEANNKAIDQSSGTSAGVKISGNSYSEPGTSACAIDLNVLNGAVIDCNDFTTTHTTNAPIRVTGSTVAHFGPNAYVDTSQLSGSPNLKAVRFENGVAYLQSEQQIAHTVTYGPTTTLSTTSGELQLITVTDTNAFTIVNPSPAMDASHSTRLRVVIYNNSGGVMGAITWNAIWNLTGGAFTNPANGKRRWISFFYDAGAVKWVEDTRATADY